MRIRLAVLLVATSLVALSGCHHHKGGYLAPAHASASATR